MKTYKEIKRVEYEGKDSKIHLLSSITILKK